MQPQPKTKATLWTVAARAGAFLLTTALAWLVVVLLAFGLWTAIGLAGHFAGLVLP